MEGLAAIGNLSHSCHFPSYGRLDAQVVGEVANVPYHILGGPLDDFEALVHDGVVVPSHDDIMVALPYHTLDATKGNVHHHTLDIIEDTPP